MRKLDDESVDGTFPPLSLVTGYEPGYFTASAPFGLDSAAPFCGRHEKGEKLLSGDAKELETLPAPI